MATPPCRVPAPDSCLDSVACGIPAVSFLAQRFAAASERNVIIDIISSHSALRAVPVFPLTPPIITRRPPPRNLGFACFSHIFIVSNKKERSGQNVVFHNILPVPHISPADFRSPGFLSSLPAIFRFAP